MERTKAVLIFDPDHYPEQMDFVTARTAILHEIGNQAGLPSPVRRQPCSTAWVSWYRCFPKPI